MTDDIVADTTASELTPRRTPAPGGLGMRNVVAAIAILAIVVLASAAYEGGRLIGSLVDLGFDTTSAAWIGDRRDAAEPGMPVRLEAREAEEVAARAAAARRAAEANGALLEAAGIAERDAWLAVVGDRCGNWTVMTEEAKLHTADVLSVEIADEFHRGDRLGAASWEVVAIIDETCEESSPDRKLVDVTKTVHGEER